MKFANVKVITDAAMSASFNSAPILLDQIYGFSFQSIFTGSPNGTFKLQCSNDDVQLDSQVSNWTDIAGTAQAITAAGSLLYNVNYAFYMWVRVVYTASSGSGSCNVTYASKGV
jgi:hypothetical protein